MGDTIFIETQKIQERRKKMNRNLLTSLAFVAGAAAGSAITWKLLKTKYEKIAQEEIDSVKEVFSRRAETVEETVEEALNSKKVIKGNQIFEIKNGENAYKME